MGAKVVAGEAQDFDAYGVDGAFQVNEDFGACYPGESFSVVVCEDFPLV